MSNSMKSALSIGLAAALGVAAGCGAPSNETKADISGVAPTEGLQKGTPPPANQTDYAKQSEAASGAAQYGNQGYPGR